MPMGKNERGKRDGTGPYKGSRMWKSGRRGKKAGHRQGDCK